MSRPDAAKHGFDGMAFTALWQRLRKIAYQQASYWDIDEYARDQLCEDVLFGLLTAARDSFEPGGMPPTDALIHTITRRQASRYAYRIRKRPNMCSLDEFQEQDVGRPLPEAMVAGSDLERNAQLKNLCYHIHAMIEFMHPENRRLLLGHCRDGFSIGELAEVLGITEVAAAARFRRCRARLFIMLDAIGYTREVVMKCLAD